MTTISVDAARKVLLAERERLVHQLEELGAAESGDLRSDLDFGGSFADAAAVTAERTEVLGLVESLRGQVSQVDRALKALDDGTYGICANCGTEIPKARLEARPESVFCVTCKTALG